MLTSKQRAFLRGEAQTLEPVVLVGKGGVSEALIADADTAITSKELIKGAVLENCPLTAREAADALAEGLSADVVQVIGRRFVLYRESAEEEKQRFDLPTLTKLPETAKKNGGGRAVAKKKPVKPGYRKAIARKKEEEQRKIAKAEKAAYFREKARAERLAAKAEEPAETAPSGSDYIIFRREK